MRGRYALEETMPGLWPTPAPAGARPDQLGHRERLRQRAASAGLAALPDYELLELVLFRTFPRGEVKPLAKALLAGSAPLRQSARPPWPSLRLWRA